MIIFCCGITHILLIIIQRFLEVLLRLHCLLLCSPNNVYSVDIITLKGCWRVWNKTCTDFPFTLCLIVLPVWTTSVFLLLFHFGFRSSKWTWTCWLERIHWQDLWHRGWSAVTQADELMAGRCVADWWKWKQVWQSWLTHALSQNTLPATDQVAEQIHFHHPEFCKTPKHCNKNGNS